VHGGVTEGDGLMSRIHPTAVVAPGANVAADATIGPYCVIGEDVSIGAGSTLASHVVVDGHTTVGRDCQLFSFACIGTQTQDLKFTGGTTHVEIGDGTTLREYVTVNSGTVDGEVTRVGQRCHILAYCHVAHGCQLGNGVIMSNLATLAGHVTIGDNVVVGGMTGIHQFVRVGNNVMLGGMTKIVKDCPPYMIIDGNPARLRGPNSIGLERHGFSTEVRKQMRAACRLLMREDLSVKQAVAEITTAVDTSPELEALLGFIETSERGITI
jgi:UDP-N-acetylglucosamine acyltransferase